MRNLKAVFMRIKPIHLQLIIITVFACNPTQLKEKTTGSPTMGSKLIIAGKRKGENIGQTVLDGLSFVRYQYNNALKEGYEGSAYMVLKIKILANGKVEEIEADTISFNFPSLKEGIFKEIKKWDFGSSSYSDDTTWIRLPLQFTQP